MRTPTCGGGVPCVPIETTCVAVPDTHHFRSPPEEDRNFRPLYCSNMIFARADQVRKVLIGAYVYYIHMCITSICLLHSYVYYIHMCITSCVLHACVLHPYVYYIHMCMYDIHMCITSIFVSNSVHVCVCVCMCIHKWFLSKSDEGVCIVCVCVCVCVCNYT